MTQHYHSKPDWATLALCAAMYAVFLGNVWLYFNFRLPAVLHVLISAAAIHLSFTVWHEAAHGNVAKERWQNSLVGIIGMFPYMTPYFIQRHVHLMHHAKLNLPEDPNSIYAGGPFHEIFFRYFRAVAFTKKLLKNDPRKPHEIRIDFLTTAAVAGIYLWALLNGRFWDAVILWAVPFVIAKIVMDWYINWLPHAGLPPHKYRGTRIIDAPWLTPLVLAHNYHAIHHLWPQYSWKSYVRIFRDQKESLIKNGVPVEHRLPSFAAGKTAKAV